LRGGGGGGSGWRGEAAGGGGGGGGGGGIESARPRHWLAQHAQVLAFCDARANAGGGGAVRVLLKVAPPRA